jgi:hypothetical protein
MTLELLFVAVTVALAGLIKHLPSLPSALMRSRE